MDGGAGGAMGRGRRQGRAHNAARGPLPGGSHSHVDLSSPVREGEIGSSEPRRRPGATDLPSAIVPFVLARRLMCGVGQDHCNKALPRIPRLETIVPQTAQ